MLDSEENLIFVLFLLFLVVIIYFFSSCQIICADGNPRENYLKFATLGSQKPDLSKCEYNLNCWMNSNARMVTMSDGKEGNCIDGGIACPPFLLYQS